MTLAALLSAAEKDGITITCTIDGAVRLRGPSATLAKWKPLLAEHKQALLAADLARLIGEAADFYQYSAEDMRLIHQTAATDPAGLHRALLSDPLHPYYTQTENRPSPDHPSQFIGATPCY